MLDVRRGVVVALVALVVLAGLTGCAPPGSEPSPPAAPGPSPEPDSSTTPPTTSASGTEPGTGPGPPASPASPGPAPPRAPRVRRVRGIDVSHHQGVIAWNRVAADGITFAYLKATEGSTFTDPRFTDNWRGAASAGLRVGGYHYFSLCSAPLPQADHFVDVLAAVPQSLRPLPPVVDLELLGNCDPPPAPDTLRDAVVAFVARVEQATGRRLVVYTHPDFDARYDFVDGLDRRRWVRRPGDVPPPGQWLLWQRSDDARVDGIEGPVDLDVMRVRVDKPR